MNQDKLISGSGHWRYKMEINEEFDALAKYERICFENEKSFLLRFANFEAWQLAQISFSSEQIRFTYVQHSGQHISSSIRRNPFIKWYEGIKNESNI